MRARELLEDYHENLKSDLDNLLIAAKGNGLEQVQTQTVADELYAMGYSVDVNSLLPLLNNNPIIMNATPQMINMTPPEGLSSGEDTADQDVDDKTSDMAMDTAQKGIEDNG